MCDLRILIFETAALYKCHKSLCLTGSGNPSAHRTCFEGSPLPPCALGRFQSAKSNSLTYTRTSSVRLPLSPPGSWKNIERSEKNTEFSFSTRALFLEIRVCRAAKLMKIVPLVCGFKSWPMACSSPSQLCLRGMRRGQPEDKDKNI